MATAINHRLIGNVRDEPTQMLQPISGYQNEPLLSLEEACIPLEGMLDNELKRNIMTAKMNSLTPADGLSPDESASIHLYTMEWAVRENSLYAVLNRTLRTADRRNLKPWFRYLKLFLTAFFKLPSIGLRTFYRGVPEDISNLYPIGKEFTWWGATSCTSRIDVLESPSYLGTSDSRRTMFHIETNSGKMIRSHSYYQSEDEILLPPEIYLKVISKFSPTKGLHMIQLCQIEPPYKMLADPFDLNQSTSISTNPSAQRFVKERDPQIINAFNKSPYSNQKLDCHGHACNNCGFCRDWYWRSVDGTSKTYRKRHDVRCIVNNYSCGQGYYYYHSSYRLCECDDNH